jgi:hypothetical protein
MGAEGGGGQEDDTGRLRAAAGRILPFCSGRSRWRQFFLEIWIIPLKDPKVYLLEVVIILNFKG